MDKDITLLKRGQTNIYTLTDPETGLIRYVGKADNINIRLNEHIRKSNVGKTHKNNWIKQLLDKKLKPIIEVVDVVPYDQWGYWEEYWINQFKTWGFKLTNTAKGGIGGNLGNIVNKKISESRKGFKHSIETKQKISTIRLGTKHSEKTKELFSLQRKGSNNSNYGKKTLESSKKYKKILQLDLDGNLIKIWDGVIIASKELLINRSSITNVCYGRNKTAGGYKWKLAN
jgi:group I intron endonuclease